ncbi:hypothetical protein JXR93_01885 [bacterium]|nr:hypothetical protein [bacterium]
MLKTVFILLLLGLMLSCSNPQESPHETVKMFFKYVSEKDLKKAYDLLSPETKKRFINNEERLLRTNFQVNQYPIKKIRHRREDKERQIHYMEVILENNDTGFISLKKIDGRFYIYFEENNNE